MECTANLWSMLAKSYLVKYACGIWCCNGNDPIFGYSTEKTDCIKGSTLWFFLKAFWISPPLFLFLMNLPPAHEICINMLNWILLFCMSPRECTVVRAHLLSATCRWHSCSVVCCSENCSGNISLSENWWKDDLNFYIICSSSVDALHPCAEFSQNLRQLDLL